MSASRLIRMTTNSATETPAAFYASTATYWFTSGHDKYGRRTQQLKATHRGQYGTVAVVVTMPKAWVESHGDDRYMVSDWRVEQRDSRPEPVYFRSLAKAKLHAEALVRLLTADEIDGLDAYGRVLAAEADVNKLAEWATLHRASVRAYWDTDRDKADMHEVMRRMVAAEIDRRCTR